MEEKPSNPFVSAPHPNSEGQIPRSIHDVLVKLENVKGTGQTGQWTADCPLPGHNTPERHLSIKDAGDKALVKDYGDRHNYQEICQALGFASLSYGKNGKEGACAGNGCNSFEGITVKDLARVKCLPEKFLLSLRVSNIPSNKQPGVRIPYFGEDGNEVAIRLRYALDGKNRFKWKKGSKPKLYGLDRLPADGWLLIVEGETDCWTGWHYNIPTLGVPGKSVWKKEWGEMLDDRFKEIYVWQEPEAEDFILKVAESLPNARCIEAPEGVKDISEAHIQGIELPSLLEKLKSNASPCGGLKDQYEEKQREEAYQAAKPIIESIDPLEEMKKAIAGLGYGGDVKPALIVYLVFTARVLGMRQGAMPPHLILLGDSSSGKNYVLSIAKSLFPVEAYHEISASSPRALIYDEAPLQHRVLIFGEADSLPAGEDNPAASAMRNLLQEHKLNYDVSIRDKQTGGYKVRHISKPGPTVLITTSTRSLGKQLMTRFFALEISDSPEQIAAKLKTQAELEMQGARVPGSDFVSFQSYLQLRAPIKVRLPFAMPLAEAMGKMKHGPRILRDFPRLLTLIKSVTVLRHRHRKIDGEGRIVAELADYDTVRELVNDVFISSTSESTEDVRIVVEAVRELNACKKSGEKVTGTMLAKHLGMHKVTISRRIRKAIRQGWVYNEEDKKGKPAKYVLGEPMPEPDGLPPASALTDCNTVTLFTDGDNPPPAHNGGKQERCYENNETV